MASSDDIAKAEALAAALGAVARSRGMPEAAMSLKTKEMLERGDLPTLVSINNAVCTPAVRRVIGALIDMDTGSHQATMRSRLDEVLPSVPFMSVEIKNSEQTWHVCPIADAVGHNLADDLKLVEADNVRRAATTAISGLISTCRILFRKTLADMKIAAADLSVDAAHTYLRYQLCPVFIHYRILTPPEFTEIGNQSGATATPPATGTAPGSGTTPPTPDPGSGSAGAGSEAVGK
jgi:hypothetical protein